MTATRVRLILADVDGTLVTQDKLLTDRATEAVHHLHDAGILFAITSGRPPRGMAMLVKPLGLQTPSPRSTGPDRRSRHECHRAANHSRGPRHPHRRADGIGRSGRVGLPWRGLVRPRSRGPHVAGETWTVKFQPKVMPRMGTSPTTPRRSSGQRRPRRGVKAWSAAHDRFGDHVIAAASQPYYLDVTHPDANKGSVARYLARRHGLSAAEIATIGDMPNDVLMLHRVAGGHGTARAPLAVGRSVAGAPTGAGGSRW